MDDEVDGGGELASNGQLLQEALARLFPGLVLLGKSFLVDDDEKVIVGEIAALAVFGPIAARIGAEQDQLEDTAALALVGEFGFYRLLEFPEQDLRHTLQLAALPIR